MFKPAMFVAATIAAGTIGVAAHAAGAASTKTAGYMYASCDSRGALLSAGSHARTCKQLSGGKFDVTFDRSVQDCAIVVTPGRPDGVETYVGDVSGSNVKNAPNVVRVHSVIAEGRFGAGLAHSFFVVVLC